VKQLEKVIKLSDVQSIVGRDRERAVIFELIARGTLKVYETEELKEFVEKEDVGNK